MTNDDQLQSANFNRPPRLQFADFQGEEVEIPAPPILNEQPEPPALLNMVPILGIGIMALIYIFLGMSGGNVSFVVPMLATTVVTVGGTVAAGRWRRRENERRRRETLLGYYYLLERKRARLQAAADAQLGILEINFPPAGTWLNFVLMHDSRLWQRRPGEPDFAAVRLGVGRTPSIVAIRLPNPETSSEALDYAFALADQYRYLQNAPIIASLTQDFALGVSGRRSDVLHVMRAIICHLAATHAPQDLHIHVITAHYAAWSWMEWLPHTSQSHRGGAADLLVADVDNIRNLMGNLGQVIDERREREGVMQIPHLLLIIDDPALVESEAVYSTILREGEKFGASAVCLVNQYANIPSACGAVLEIKDGGRFRYARTGSEGYEVEGDAVDSMSAQDAEHIARALSSVIMREAGSGGRIPRRVDFLELYNTRRMEDLVGLLERRWREPLVNGVLPRPVPIGRESLAVDTVIMLDEEHHGPHGVLAGTTGSGKSALMQTLICALALEHDPRLVNFLLIDFKGGSTFNIFNSLPHTAGTVTNLDGSIVSRALEALRAETQWRQEFLKVHNSRDINQYHKNYDAQRDAPDYQSLPHLLIIVDEFAQLAKEMPEFMRELVRTAQVGRSLGLHLILGTQSPMDVITEEMNANLQFRICLRVQNIEASRAMLRRPDAAFLPTDWRGRGYFQVGTQGMFKQFQAANVVVEYNDNPVDEEEEAELELMIGKNYAMKIIGNGATSPEAAAQGNLPSAAEVISQTIADFAQRAGFPTTRPILLPPLRSLIPLGEILTSLDTAGWNGSDWLPLQTDETGKPVTVGSVPVGILDDVYNRQQNLFWLHLNISGSTTRRDGHVLIIGSPGSGKSTIMRTLALSLALLYSPDQVQMFFLSFTGKGLDSVSNLPHAEHAIHGTEGERVRRLFGRLIQTLNMRQAGGDTNPKIIVFIDQFEQLRDTYRDTLYADFERLLQEGRAAGIYIVVSANTVDTVPDRLRSVVQQRIVLQVGNKMDYTLAVGRIATPDLPSLPPGQGYIYSSPPLLCQIAFPAMEIPSGDEIAASRSLDSLVLQLRTSYQRLKGLPDLESAQAPAPIRELPLVIPLNTLPISEGQAPSRLSRVISPLGRWDDDPLSLCNFDWWENGPHFIVTGPPGSGKTNLLQAAVLSVARHYSPADVRFLLVDFAGRSLRGLDNLKHVIRRVTDAIELRIQLAHLQSELSTFYAKARDDESKVFPATVVIIDDYDLTSEAVNTEILTHLRDHVRLHSEFGLYLWVSSYLERVNDPLMKQLLLRRSGFALSTRESLQKLNVRTTGLSAEGMPEGRAYVQLGNKIGVVQTALVTDVPEYVRQINNELWRSHQPARWLHPASEEQVRQQTGEMFAKPSAGGESGLSLDIDTEGLINDLLGTTGRGGS